MNFNIDYYAILGVLPTAEEVVIRAAYKALALRYHPDRFKGTPSKMAEINYAYAILSDPTKRREYDAHRSKVGEGDSYFDEKNKDIPPEYDPLDQAWKSAVRYYPDLQEIESSLAQIAWRLAYAYRASLLETKEFSKREEIAKALENNFLELYFGKNQQIVEFARKLIYQSQKEAARELNKAVHIFGDGIDAKMVIAKIIKDFFDPCVALYKVGDILPDGGIIYYVDELGRHGLAAQPADDEMRFSVWRISGWNQAKRLAESHGEAWYLPTKDELALLYQRKGVVGGFRPENYWSSSEYDNLYAWTQDFVNGTQCFYNKDLSLRVRAVRAF